MKKKIDYGTYSYEYHLILQERKTLSLTVEPNCSIVLKAPLGIAEEKIDTFLKKKWQWLEKQLCFFSQFSTQEKQKMSLSGESHLYLGRQYKLLVVRGKSDHVTLSCGKIQITTTNRVRDSEYNKKLLDTWYKDRAQVIFSDCYTAMSKKFSYETMPSLSIRKMNKRWGSYTKDNKILLNQKLIFTSKKCIEYVIVHELCHVEHRLHTSQFFSLLKKKYPRWQEVKHCLEMRFAK